MRTQTPGFTRSASSVQTCGIVAFARMLSRLVLLRVLVADSVFWHSASCALTCAPGDLSGYVYIDSRTVVVAGAEPAVSAVEVAGFRLTGWNGGRVLTLAGGGL